MDATRLNEIYAWIDCPSVKPQKSSLLPRTPPHSHREDSEDDGDDRHEQDQVRKRRNSMSCDPEQTPRASKRQRNIDTAIELLPASPTASFSSGVSSEALSQGSIQSGRSSPLKQLQKLQDLTNQPVGFRNLGDNDGQEFDIDKLEEMRTAVQSIADGVSILSYSPSELSIVIASLPPLDQRRFAYPWASAAEQRPLLGSMPGIAQIAAIVKAALSLDRVMETSESEWNSRIHLQILSIAHQTSIHTSSLQICDVQTAAIQPRSLARASVPRRVVDFAIAMQPDRVMSTAWRNLQPTSVGVTKSWNHTLKIREMPLVVHIQTKSSKQSWTDARPQVAIWTDAWFKRLELLISSGATLPFPPTPLLIVQGHDWHFLITSRNDKKMTIWEQIQCGSTRTCFDAMKVVVILHWIMDWIESVWRPFFHQLISNLT